MRTPEEKAFFLREGYLHVPGVLTSDLLEQLRSEYDRVWSEGNGVHVNQQELLRHRAFIDLIEYPPILERHRGILETQVQLLQYDLLYQAPGSDFPPRVWHRDLVHPGDFPLSINTILYLDDMPPERGPTYVIPGSHRGYDRPPKDRVFDPLPGETPVLAAAGDAVFINSAIWHSASRNVSDGVRRTIYLYYGHWWMKPYEADQARPWQCLVGASEQRLCLLGYRMPDGDLHQYPGEPDVW
ncbi:MAG: phytanoyl-CoA dioxygenase family protein [Capsulimonadales bacterium]|nr:phytanoyl-CoA dioxygenase family protein [Capsulimonadales bacterium]